MRKENESPTGQKPRGKILSEELLRRFDQREREEPEAQKNTINWKAEGF
jgi:hypothetical protein